MGAKLMGWVAWPLVLALFSGCGGGDDDPYRVDEALSMAGADEWLQVQGSVRPNGGDEASQVINERASPGH